MNTNRFSAVGMALFCSVVTWASSPVPFTAYDFQSTPTGTVATLEFDSAVDQVYSVMRSDNLTSNSWTDVHSQVPGTGSSMVLTDLPPLSSSEWFYKATSDNAPPVNLLVNGDFEIGTVETSATKTNPFVSPPWVRRVWTDAWLSVSPTEAGEKSIRFRWAGTTVDQDFSALADRTYLFSVEVYNPTDTDNRWEPRLQAEWYDASSNKIGSTITIDQSNNTVDPVQSWYELSGSLVAPANVATGRIVLACSSRGSQYDEDTIYYDNAQVTLVPLGASVSSVNWGSFGSASLAAAAQYSGLYALADDTAVEIYRIDESSAGTTAVTDAKGMAFTASGRQLFISSPSKVQAFNVGTGTIRDFVTGLSLGSEKTGIAHFKGELFVGSSTGEIRRYAADLADNTGSYNGSINFSGADAGQPVRGIAVDIQDEMLYVASPNNLYRLNPATSALTQIAALSGIKSISFGRTYGAAGQGGVMILQDAGSKDILHRVSTSALQAGGSVTPNPYYEQNTAIADIGMTACGRILSAGSIPVMFSDTNDTRMDFMTWVADEFDQNVLFAKNLLNTSLSGMVRNHAVKDGANWIVVASPDSAYWVVCQLLMSDEVNGDPEAQGMVRSILERHAQLEVNTDGHWYHWYNSVGGYVGWGSPDPTAQTSIYSTMKGVHMAIRAKEYYPNDAAIVAAADTIIGNLRNQRDYVRNFGGIRSPADDLGPTVGSGVAAPYQEIHLASEMLAASEPMCENSYLDYWRYRDNHGYKYTLPDEPIVPRASGGHTSGFWRMYDQATVAFCREDTQWLQEFKNFYALFAGWTDDNAPDHLTAFSAGPTPSGYSADKYDSHPGTVNSFGTVIGFGLQGDTVPVVGAYFAYRDGQRQLMEGSTHDGANLLTRKSYENPAWEMNNLSPTDHQYAGYALGEILSPGSIDRAIANHTYLEPQWYTEGNGDKTVEFAQLVRRQVWGTADGSNWDFLGYQLTPFTVPAASVYTNFTVLGAEGELLDPTSATATEEDYDVSADFDGTLYLLRAVTDNPTAQLRARWYNGGSLLSEQTGSPVGLYAAKPSAATILRVALVNGGIPIAADQLSVVLDGAEVVSHTNQGFELGNLNNWGGWDNSGITRSNVADGRLEGARACRITASTSANNNSTAALWCDFDISGDPIGTHYVFEQDVLTENLQGSSIQIRVEILDAAYVEIGREYFDTYENADSQTILSAGERKRTSDFAILRYLIELRRDDKSAVTAEERVFIDNLRMLKMNP